MASHSRSFVKTKYTLVCLLLGGVFSTACESQVESEPVPEKEAAEVAASPTGGNGDFSMPIMDVFTITGKGVVMTGRVSSGSIAVNETVCVPLNSGEAVARTVVGIEQFRKILDRIGAGENGGILVEGVDRTEIKKGANLDTDCI